MQEHRVYGPPGTGKTTYLTGLVEQASQFFGGGGVMVASYTTAAASEVSRRAQGIPEDNVGTLHKFCYNAIGRPPVVEGKGKLIKDWNTFCPAFEMSAPGCRDINSGIEYGESNTLGDTLLAQTTVLRNRMIPREAWPQNAKAFYEAWKSFKASVAGIDYTDMLELALSDCHCAPNMPRIIFVDEAQDCTALQFAVLKQWAQETEKLIMVGDDDQCIYQFAGATPEAFAVGEIGPNDRLLDQSYRVPYAVWEHATDWISKAPDRVEKDYLPKRSPDPGFVKRCPYNWKQGEKIVDLIEKTITRYENVMVIGSCSYMIEPVKKALQDAGLPFHNPYRYIRADWNPLKLTTGTTFAQRLAAFLKPQINKQSWGPTDIKAWSECLKADGVFNHGFKKKLNEEDFTRTPIHKIIIDFFTDEAREHIVNLDLAWWKENLVNEEAQRKAAFPLKVVDRFGDVFLDADEVPPSVTIGTIHSVKGGEADVVIIFPDLSQEGMQEWTGKGRSAIRRLMYVGITRAKQGVFICKPASPYTCDL